MATVGVRELRQHASRVLDRVKAGETIDVTEYGRPVARLVPLDKSDGYRRLVEDGEILVGSQDVLSVHPVSVPSGVRMSDDLAALRDDDWR